MPFSVLDPSQYPLKKTTRGQISKSLNSKEELNSQIRDIQRIILRLKSNKWHNYNRQEKKSVNQSLNYFSEKNLNQINYTKTLYPTESLAQSLPYLDSEENQEVFDYIPNNYQSYNYLVSEDFLDTNSVEVKKQDLACTKNKSRSIQPILSIIFLLFIFFGFVFLGFSRYLFLVENCKNTLKDIQTELALSEETCSFDVTKIGNLSLDRSVQENLDILLLPNLPEIKNAEQIFAERNINFQRAKQELQLKKQIVSILLQEEQTEAENLQIEELLAQKPQGKDWLLNYTAIYTQKSLELQQEIELYQKKAEKEQNLLREKLSKLKQLGLENNKARQLADLNLHKVQNLQEAEEFRKIYQEISQVTLEVDKQIKEKEEKIQQEQEKIKAINSQMPVNLVRLPILMYHRIEDYERLPDNQKSWVRKDLTTSPENFVQQLDFLQAKGYQTVTLQDIEKAVLQKDKDFFNRKLVMLTFDDGYKEHYTIVFPELKKRNMRGVFGIYTKSREISPEQLKEMHNNGMEIVSHTVSHCMLGSNQNSQILNPQNGYYRACSNRNYGFANQPLIPLEEMRYELRESKKILENWLDTEIRYYIHTYGVYNSLVLQVLKQEGYTLALAVGGGPNINLDNPLALQRVTVSGHHPALGGWFATVD